MELVYMNRKLSGVLSETVPEDVINMIALKAALYTGGNEIELLLQALRAYHPILHFETGETTCPYCDQVAEKGTLDFTTTNNVTVKGVPGTQCLNPECGRASFDLQVVGEIERSAMGYEEGTLLTLDQLLSE